MSLPDKTAPLSLIDIADPSAFAARGYPHAEWTFLRKNDPVYRYEHGNKRFWAITTHADISSVLLKPQLFSIAYRRFLTLSNSNGQDGMFRNLTHMDRPEHSVYRAVVNRGFTPSAIRKLHTKVETIVRDQIEIIAQKQSCDFVTDFAAPIPLAVIGGLLGTPDEDWPKLLHWANILGGANDPEYTMGIDESTIVEETAGQLFEYFADFLIEKSEHPTDDIGSIVAAAEIDGKPMQLAKMLSYFYMLVLGGNETTRNTISGGLLALLEFPDQYEKLRADPSMMTTAMEEMFRWTTPIVQLSRRAMEDTELHGKKIEKGDDVVLFYPSANRDELIFDDPFAFRLDRSPNPHIAFGVGEHFCLGVSLARLELVAVFRQLLDHVESIELVGPVDRLRSSVIGGIKHMPVKLTMKASRPSRS